MPTTVPLTKLKDNKVVVFKKSTLVNPISVFHARFANDYDMEHSPQNWNTYHRSAFKKIPGVSLAQSRYIGNQDGIASGMYAKTGTYYSPLAFPAYKKHIKPILSVNETVVLPAYWYNRLLDYQKWGVSHIAKEIKELALPNITANADYQYTCLLIKVTKPNEVKSDTDWVNFLSIFLMTLMNSLAAERGINIEIHRRASFGFLRPGISECAPSLRITIGLCPQEYLEVIVDALNYLNCLVDHLSIFKGKFDNGHLHTIYTKYKQAHSKANTTAKETIWDSLWSVADSKGHSFIYQMFRKEHVIEYLIDQIFDECINSSIEEIFKKTSNMKKVFALPFLKIFSAFKFTKNKTLSISTDEMKHQSFSWGDASTINDEHFWDIFSDLARTLGAQEEDINNFITAKNTNELYRFLDYLIQEFYFHPTVKPEEVADGCGSDSECEEDISLDDEESCPIHSKKVITATGMRAIQMAYSVARTYLTEEHRVDPMAYKVSDTTMYYETAEAIKSHSIPDTSTHPKKLITHHSGIAFFDANFCNTKHLKPRNLLTEIQPGDFICIIDVTCATTLEMQEKIKYVFGKKAVKVILLVSSGFKNEQTMSDLNPYGTIRIFAREKKDCDYAYQKLVALEKMAKYKHPKESHMLRLQAKQHGMTPTSKVILRAEEQPDELASNSNVL